MMKRSAPVVLLVGMLILWPQAATAQDPPPPDGPPAQTELAFEREIFVYPSFERLNPFRPLLATDSGGPRYERLRLSGIIYFETPGRSVATVSTSIATIAADGTISADIGDSYHLKVGQTIGNTTVVVINRKSIEVEVEEFGITDRRTMRLLSVLGGNQ
ncbi:MAG: hypothetical protein IIB36_13075 [Gemmatimonadetes bacterium]|nr:hypothetical protein [Gemmatimonadota bacterium]